MTNSAATPSAEQHKEIADEINQGYSKLTLESKLKFRDFLLAISGSEGSSLPPPASQEKEP